METHCQERENLIGEDLKRGINQKNKSGLKGQQISKMCVDTVESRHIKGQFHCETDVSHDVIKFNMNS